MENLEHSLCVLLKVLEENEHSIRVFKQIVKYDTIVTSVFHNHHCFLLKLH